jgi:4a-hydroxytetrahydrobiopterin dehydratase
MEEDRNKGVKMTSDFFPEDLEGAIGKLDGWKIKEGRLYKCFVFDSHLDAVKFVEAVSLEAVGEDNYPEISLTYEKAELYLPDPDSSLSQKDFDLARKIDKFSDCYSEK